MKGAWLAVALGLLSACLEPSLTPCGELLCAEGSTCVADTLCGTPEQIAACAGEPDEATCQSSLGTGHCVLGVCLANVCGDGQVTGSEVCDGAEVTLLCGDFGFYGGDLACTPSCTIDRAGCQGRCGDDVVQAEFGELCDGDTQPPVDGCLDFGHDYGHLTCNAFCAPDVARDCERYGWETLLPASADYRDADANARGVVGLNALSGVDVVWDGVASSRLNPGWLSVVANATVIAAVGPSSIGWFDGQWHELAFGVTANWVALADDGHLFASTGASCTIVEIDLGAATMSTLPVPPVPTCASAVAIARDALYVPQGLQGVGKWNGSAWTIASPTNAVGVMRAGPQRLASKGPSGVTFIDISQTPAVSVAARYRGVFDTIVFDNDGNELQVFVDGDAQRADFTLRESGAAFPAFPNDDPFAIVDRRIKRSGSGGLLAVTPDVRVMRATQLAQSLPIDTEITDVLVTDDGVLVCGSDTFVSGATSFFTRPYDDAVHGTCLEAIGVPLGEHFLITSSSGLIRYNAGNNTYESLLGGSFSSIAGDHAQIWLATGISQLVGITNVVVGSATIANLPSTCTVEKVAMSPARTFYGAGMCGTKLAIFKLTTAWTTLATSAFDVPIDSVVQLEVGSDDAVFLRADSSVYRLDAGSFTLVGTGSLIGAVTATDLFIEQAGEIMSHVTGSTTSEIRVPVGPFAASRTHLFSWDRISRRLIGIARVPSAPNGP